MTTVFTGQVPTPKTTGRTFAPTATATGFDPFPTSEVSFFPSETATASTRRTNVVVPTQQPTRPVPSTNARPSSSTSIALIKSSTLLLQPGVPTAIVGGGGGGGGGSGGGGSGGSGGGGTDGVNGRGGDISDQASNSSMPSKTVIGGSAAVVIVVLVAAGALVYYRRVKQKEKERRTSAGPFDPQGYDDDYNATEASNTGRYL